MNSTSWIPSYKQRKKNKFSFALSIYLTLMTTKAPISFEYLVQCRRCEELEKNNLTPTSRPSSCFEMSNHHTIGFIVFFAKQCRTISILLSQLDCYLRVRVAQISSISASSRYSSDRMKREEMNFQFSIFTFTRMTEHRSSHFELNINLVIKWRLFFRPKPQQSSVWPSFLIADRKN